jgi:AbrB family looped-hinge helix DNA binding protein
MPVIEVEIQLRPRNQITVPAEAAAGLGIHAGDRLLLRVDPDLHTAEVRPLRASYAGIAGDIYGRTQAEVKAYIKGERDAWAE